jgi:hypothetical protein
MQSRRCWHCHPHLLISHSACQLRGDDNWNGQGLDKGQAMPCDHCQARCLSRELTQPYNLQIASFETVSALMEELMELTLVWWPLWTWMFVVGITNELILEQNILCIHDAPVDIGYHGSWLDEEEMLLQCIGAPPQSFPYTDSNSEVILAQYGKDMQLESPLAAADSLMGPGLKSACRKGWCRARTQVRLQDWCLWWSMKVKIG